MVAIITWSLAFVHFRLVYKIAVNDSEDISLIRKVMKTGKLLLNFESILSLNVKKNDRKNYKDITSIICLRFVQTLVKKNNTNLICLIIRNGIFS